MKFKSAGSGMASRGKTTQDADFSVNDDVHTCISLESPLPAVHPIAFFVGTFMMTLQIVNFQSDSYMSSSGFQSPVTDILFKITHQVTEFNLHNPFHDYILSMSLIIGLFLLMSFSRISKSLAGWTTGFALVEILLPWVQYLFLPLSLPHLRFILPCISYANKYSDLPHPFYPTFHCYTNDYIGYFVLSIIFFAFLFTVNLLTLLCHFNTTIPNKLQAPEKVYDSRRSSEGEVYFFFLKVFLLVCYLLADGASLRGLMGGVALAFGVGISGYYLYSLPWWNDLTMTIYLWQGILLIWVSLCLLLQFALDDMHDVVSLFVVGFPLTLVIACFLMRARTQTVSFLKAEEISSSNSGMLFIRHTLNAFYQRIQGDGDFFIEYNDIKEDYEKTIATLDATLEFLISRFSNDAEVYLLSSLYYINVKHSRIFAYQSLSQMKKCSQNVLHRYMYYTLYSELSLAAHIEQAQDLKAYLEVKERIEDLNIFVCEATRLLVTFWTLLLMGEQPDLDALTSLGERAHTLVEKCLANFERIIALNPENTQILRLYGTYLLEIMGDAGRANECFKKAHFYSNSSKSDFSHCNFGDDRNDIHIHMSVFDEDNGIVTVMNNEHELGKVISTNHAFLNIFGFYSQGIVNNNIAKCVPSPISDNHDQFLKLYFHRRTSRVVGHTLLTLALHQSGFIFPIALHIRWSDESLGQMLALIRPLIIPHEACAFVDTQDLRLFHATESFCNLLGYGKSETLACNITLLDIFPEASPGIHDDNHKLNTQILARMNSQEGYKTLLEHQITGKKYQVAVWLKKQMALTSSYYLLRILFYGGLHEGEEHPVDSEEEELHGYQAHTPESADNLQAQPDLTYRDIPLHDSDSDEDDNALGYAVASKMETATSAHTQYSPTSIMRKAKNNTMGNATGTVRVVAADEDPLQPITGKEPHMDADEKHREAIRKGQRLRNDIHKTKLRRAIRASGKQTQAKMTKFSMCILAVFTICAILMLLQWIVLVLFLEELKENEKSMYKASTRQIKGYIAAYQLFIARQFHQYRHTADQAAMSLIFLLSFIHTNANYDDVYDGYLADIKANIMSFQSNTLQVDVNPQSKARRMFLTEESVNTNIRMVSNLDQQWMTKRVPFREFIDLFVGNIFQSMNDYNSPTIHTDSGYGYVFSSIVTEEYGKTMEHYMNQQLAESTSYLEVVALATWLLGGGGLLVCIVAWVFIQYPILILAEEERLKVLQIFLGIPMKVRMKLRSRAFNIHKRMLDDEESMVQDEEEVHGGFGKVTGRGMYQERMQNNLTGRQVILNQPSNVDVKSDWATGKVNRKQFTSKASIQGIWRYSVFMLIFIAFFGVSLYYQYYMQDIIDQSLRIVVLSSYRTGYTLRAFNYITINLFMPATFLPSDPLYFEQGNYLKKTVESVHSMVKAYHDVIYGNPEQGFKRPAMSKEQDYILYHQVCQPESSYDIMTSTFANQDRSYAYLLPSTCEQVYGSILKQGFMTMLYTLEDGFLQGSTPSTGSALNYILTNGGVPFGFHLQPPLMQYQVVLQLTNIITQFSVVIGFYFQFLLPTIEYSTYLYYLRALSLIDDYITQMIILMSSMVVVIFLSYIVLIRPLMKRTAQVAKETHAIMFLLPLQVGSSKLVQEFINRHLELH